MDDKLQKLLEREATRGEPCLLRSHFPFAVSRVAAPRTLSFVCSTEGAKRDGHSIRTAGWELDNYLKTGAPVQWCHDLTCPTIGNAPTMRIEREGKRLVTEVVFAPEEARHDLADLLYRLYDAGVMRCGSVQWKPLEWKPREDEQGRVSGFEFVRQELLEFSLVPVPADPDAIVRAVQTRLLSGDEAEKLVWKLNGERPAPVVVRVDVATPETRQEEPPPEPTPEPAPEPPSPPAEEPVLINPPAPEPPPVAASTEPPPSAPLQTTPSVRSLGRGELMDAMDNDEEAKLYTAFEEYRRVTSHLLRLCYQMQPGDGANAGRIDDLLSEFADVVRPYLLAIAENSYKSRSFEDMTRASVQRAPQNHQPTQAPPAPDDRRAVALSDRMGIILDGFGVTGDPSPDITIDLTRSERAHARIKSFLAGWDNLEQ